MFKKRQQPEIKPDLNPVPLAEPDLNLDLNLKIISVNEQEDSIVVSLDILEKTRNITLKKADIKKLRKVLQI